METLRENLKKILPADCDIELTDDQLEACTEKALLDIKNYNENPDLKIEDLDERDQLTLAQGTLALAVYKTMIEYALKTMEIGEEQVSVDIDKTTADLVKLYNEQVDKFNGMLEAPRIQLESPKIKIVNE